MGCEKNYYSNQNCGKDCILETVKKIDQMQKEVLLEKMCEGCDSPLFRRMYNTKPITFYLCNGSTFEARIPESHLRTDLFRIEDVKGDCVLLRLIRRDGQELECMDHTVLFKIDCACAIQCFEPICCERCQKRCGH